MIRIELRKILNIIAEKSDNSTRNSVVDLVVIRESGLPESETRKYINELKELHMITTEHRVKGVNVEGKPYKLINLTIEGLKVLRDQDEG